MDSANMFLLVFSPSAHIKNEMAHLFVEEFPFLKDPSGVTGHVSLSFFFLIYCFCLI